MSLNKTNRKIFIGCVSAAICEILFGLSYLFTKQVTSVVDELSLLSWRFLIAFVVMSVLRMLRIIKIHLKGKELKSVLQIALFQPVIYFVAETYGIRATTASESGSLLACIPIVTILASTLILKKKPYKMQVTGIVITIAGVLCCVLSKGLDTSFSVFGYLMLLVAAVSYSLYCVFVEKADCFTDIEKTYIMITIGAIVFTGIAIIQNTASGTIAGFISLPFVNSDFCIAILYQGMGCSVLAFFLSNVAIANIGTNRTASFVGLSTVVSIIAGVVLLKENFAISQVIGTILIVGGVYVSNMKYGKEI